MKSGFGWEDMYIYQIYEYFIDFIHERNGIYNELFL